MKVYTVFIYRQALYVPAVNFRLAVKAAKSIVRN